jgi:hypothetical protein
MQLYVGLEMLTERNHSNCDLAGKPLLINLLGIHGETKEEDGSLLSSDVHGGNVSTVPHYERVGCHMPYVGCPHGVAEYHHAPVHVVYAIGHNRDIMSLLLNGVSMARLYQDEAVVVMIKETMDPRSVALLEELARVSLALLGMTMGHTFIAWLVEPTMVSLKVLAMTILALL